MEYWFVADTHFSHANILKYCNRPFEDIQKHDEALIQNWNDRVKAKDHVYHLGDFAFGNATNALLLKKRLNGKIFLIEGNHDFAANEIKREFEWCERARMIRINWGQENQREIFLSHYAHFVWPKSHYGCFHLYGHSHNTLPDDLHSMSMDVGVDATAARLSGLSSGITPPIGSTKPEHYRPISLDEVIGILEKREFRPSDGEGDISGTKIGKWTVLRYIRRDKHCQDIYLCKCECGIEAECIKYNLMNDLSNGCKTCMNSVHDYKEELPGPIWDFVVKCARRRKMAMGISREQAYALFLAQDRKCALTGMPICFARNMKSHAEGTTTASLDRIDSSMSYVLDNVQWVHKDVNRMKNVFSQDYFIKICSAIAENYKTRIVTKPLE